MHVPLFHAKGHIPQVLEKLRYIPMITDLKLLKINLFTFIPACMCVGFACMKFIRRKKVGVGSPRTVDTGSVSCHVCSGTQNPGPVQEQQALLAAEPSSWP